MTAYKTFEEKKKKSDGWRAYIGGPVPTGLTALGLATKRAQNQKRQTPFLSRIISTGSVRHGAAYQIRENCGFRRSESAIAGICAPCLE